MAKLVLHSRRSRSGRSASYCLLLVVFLAVPACDIGLPPGNQEGPGRRSQTLRLTPQQELELGRIAYSKIMSKYRDRILPGDDPQVKRVRTIAYRIVKAAGIEPLQREINLHVQGYRFEWRVNVIESPQVNAFCLPGGKMAVFTGILRVAENDDQLATVISHEIAHALAHHSNERVTREESGQVNVILEKAFDRQQESEADHIGLFLMPFAGYDPHEAVRFWQRMGQLSRGGRTPEFLSDHPSDERRMRDMEQWVPKALAAKKAFDEGHITPAPGR
jgi:metalloendopeptidase OMA1, mitochondrial